MTSSHGPPARKLSPEEIGDLAKELQEAVTGANAKRIMHQITDGFYAEEEGLHPEGTHENCGEHVSYVRSRHSPTLGDAGA